MRESFLPYYEPTIEDDDVAAVTESMKRGWLTTGPKAQEFERQFASVCGVRHAVALSSCTAGLHLGLIALGIAKDDEVIMPSLSFVAGANCARQLGAKPVFCDIDEGTLCITPATIEKVRTPNTKAIMPMHYGGQPAGMSGIVSYAREHNLAVLEDAAHGAGTLDDGRWPGTTSDAGVYSFYATKNLTSAEGGMLVTNNDAIASSVRLFALHGMNRDAWKRYTQGGTWQYDVPVVGYKYNLPDIEAALGISQLRKLPNLQRRRDELATQYVVGLRGIPGIRPVAEPLEPPNRHSWCIFAIRIDADKAGLSREALIDELRKRNIGTSVHFIPTHHFSAYKNESAELPVTTRVCAEIVSLPLFPKMTDGDVADVVAAIRGVVGSNIGSARVMAS